MAKKNRGRNRPPKNEPSCDYFENFQKVIFLRNSVQIVRTIFLPQCKTAFFAKNRQKFGPVKKKLPPGCLRNVDYI